MISRKQRHQQEVEYMPDININNSNIQGSSGSYLERTRRSNIKIVDKRNDQLDKASFLKLLVKQLKHQDPLQPVSDKEFIAQMAQFSALEQMHNVANSMDSLKAFQANFLLGKHVTGKDFVTGKRIGGIVKQVFFDSRNQVFLSVDGRRIKFSELTSVDMSTPVQNQMNKMESSDNGSSLKTVGSPSSK